MKKKASLAKALENLDMEAVSRVAKNAELEEIALLESSTKSYPFMRNTKGIRLQHNCGSEILSLEEGDENLLPILCHFSVSAFPKESPKKVIMKIEATFLITYNINLLNQFDKKDIDMFSKINPIYNTWPFWREFVQDTTTRMGFPALVIPLLKIQPKPKAEKKADLHDQ